MVKTTKEFTEADKKVVEKNFRAKKIRVCGMGPKEYDRISTWDTTKGIWEALQMAYEGTTQSEDKSNTGEEIGYDSTFALITQSDDDEDNGNKEDRDSLILELKEFEHTREDLVVAVTDHKKTIEILRKEKSDLLAETAHQREIIVKPWTKSKPESFERGKEIAKATTALLPNDSKKGREQGSKGRKLLTTLRVRASLSLITGLVPNVGTLCASKKVSRPRINQFRKTKQLGTEKGSVQQWFMDSGYSKHMTGNTTDFLSLKSLQGGSVSFGNGKNGYILGIGKVGKSLAHSIENVYYVNVLKYSLLSVSQIYDKGIKVEFLPKICTVTDLVTGEIVLVAKRYKNIYVADFESLQSGDLHCLKAVD
ncbi:uncharacterized protein [Nicotiana sylvestris]|uniref:uncharacterized protein n=1 Tax=Nicotiana sylvestris TaxID=4096 RepID=UPI00388CCFB8